MTALLTSVRSVDEARDAARSGADMIDLKEPRAGALGALPTEVIRLVVTTMRAEFPHLLLSATIGDLEAAPLAEMEAMADAVGACGVDYVKVGIAQGSQGQAALDYLINLPWRIVPVLLCDDGLDMMLVEHACTLAFPAIMADTARKQAGNLFECVPSNDLRHLVQQAQGCGLQVGLAGALRLADLPQLRAMAPDFAGFRSALCIGERDSRLDRARVAQVRAGLYGTPSAEITSHATASPLVGAL
jgi:uncharacterized protein (UPF0264 family)